MFPCLGPSLSDVIKGLCHSSKLCVAPKQSAAVIFRQFFLPEGEETTLRMCLTTSFASFSGHLNEAANPEKIKRGILHIGFEAAWDSATSTIAVSPFSILSFAPSLNSSKIKSYEIHDTFACSCMLIAQSDFDA